MTAGLAACVDEPIVAQTSHADKYRSGFTFMRSVRDRLLKNAWDGPAPGEQWSEPESIVQTARFLLSAFST